MRTISFWVACGYLMAGLETVSAQTAAEYYFTPSNGSYWEYHTLGSPVTWQPRTTLYRLEGTDSIAGRIFYREKAVEFPDNNPADTLTNHVLWLRVDSLGNVLFGAFSDSSSNIGSALMVNPPWPIFPNEVLNAGYTRTWLDPRFQVQDSVESTTETVSVPAGIFNNCLKISSREFDSTGTVIQRKYAYYARNVGQVLSIRDFPANQFHQDELIRFGSVTSVKHRKSDLITGKVSASNLYFKKGFISYRSRFFKISGRSLPGK